MKEEALKLANELDALHQYVPSEAPAMIRRLVEELENERRKAKAFRQSNQVADTQIKALVEELNKLNGCLIAEQEHNEMLQTKPLSDEEIDEIGDEVSSLIDTYAGRREFARGIEERHGIQ